MSLNTILQQNSCELFAHSMHTTDLTALTINGGVYPPSPSPPSPSAAFLVYVNKGGNDITGNGSILAPYQTIAYAMSTITFAGIGFPVVIDVGPGVYLEPILSLKPNVFINGYGKQDTIIDISGAMTLEMGWDPLLMDKSGFYNIAIQGSGTFNIDFTAVSSAQGSLLFDSCLFETLSILNITGNSGGITANQVSFVSSVLVCDVLCNDMFIVVLNCFLTNPNFTLNNTVSLFSIINNSSIASLTITAIMPYNLQASNSNCQLLNANGPINIQCSTDFLPINANVTLAGGANIIYLNDAYGLGYTPTTPGDWMAVPVNVQEALDELAGTGSGFTNPMTTQGDMIYQDLGVPARLAVGAQDTFLASNGTDPNWVGTLYATATNTGLGNTIPSSAVGNTNTYVGYNISGAGTGDVIIGANASIVADTDCVVIGASANNILGSQNVIVGQAANSNGAGANIVIGASASNIGGQNTLIGGAASLTGTDNTVVGRGNSVIGDQNVVVGSLCTSAASGVTCLGKGTNDGGFNTCICLGFGATATAASQFALGSAGAALTTSATASAGIAVLPVAPLGFLPILLNGIVVKVPYYDV